MLDGGSVAFDSRVNGVILEVLREIQADLRFACTLADVVGELGETLVFDNEGQGVKGVRPIRLTANAFAHLREVRANAVTIPGPMASQR